MATFDHGLMQFLTGDFLVLSLELYSPTLESDVVLELLDQFLNEVKPLLSCIKFDSLQDFLVLKISCKCFRKACFLADLYRQVNSFAFSPINIK